MDLTCALFSTWKRSLYINHVVMLQQMFFYRLTVHHGAIGAPQIQNKRPVGSCIDGGMLPAHRKVIDDNIISRTPTYGHPRFGNTHFLLYQTIKGDDDFRHKSLINSM